jgi:hypothetical protein
VTSADFIVTCLLEELELISQWPDDFQVILYDYLEWNGVKRMPQAIRVKTVPVDAYIDQAREMEYSSGDNRRHPEYLADLMAYMRGGGKVPPIIIDGNKLMDGRHRLLAMAGATHVQAIDLNDLNAVTEAVTITRQAITKAVKTTLRDYIKAGEVKCAYDVGSGPCEDFAHDVLAKLDNPFGGTEGHSVDAIEYANLTGEGNSLASADGIFYPETLAAFKVKLPPDVTVDLLNKSELGDIGTHIFLRWASPQGYVYFDAEAPQGVDSPFDLPFAQRYLNIARLHNW